MKSSHRIITLSSILASLCLHGLALAEEQDPIIVTATRTPQLADETLSPVIVIERKDIERNPAADVADLLRFHAGIEISRNGGPGQQTSVFIRGADSNQTMVMINGVKINPGTIGGASIQNIDPNMIERIEIVKGPRSTLYGSDAIGGVINIITRRSDAGAKYAASAGSGSDNTKTANASALYEQEDRGAGIIASYFDTNGFPTRTASNIDSGYTNKSLQTYVHHRFGKHKVELSYWYTGGNTEYLDFFLNPAKQDFLNSSAVLNIESNFKPNWLSKFKLSSIRDKIDQQKSPDYAHTTRNVIDWQNDIQLNNHNLLTAGLYYSNDDIAAVSFGSKYNDSPDVNAVFVQDDFMYGPHKLLAGARYNDNSEYDNRTSWNLEYGYAVTPTLRLIAAANTGYRAPDSTDRFGFGGNPDLKPEKSENYEFDIKYIPNQEHKLYLNLFHNRINDLIEFNTTTSVVGNIGKARIQGLEFGYEFSAAPWHVKTELIFQDPQNRDTDSRLLRRARKSATASLSYTRRSFQIATDILYSGDRRDFGGVDLSDYTLLNLSALYRFTAHWTMTGRIENLTDENYQLADGFNTQDRSAYVELAYRLE